MRSKSHPLFKIHNGELHQEAHIISTVESVPHGQKHQRHQLTDQSIVEELQPLVHILGRPVIRIHIKRIDVMLVTRRILEAHQPNVRTARPVRLPLLLVERDERQAKAHGGSLAQQPHRNVFVQRKLSPQRQHQPTLHQIQFAKLLRQQILIRHVSRAQLVHQQIPNANGSALQTRPDISLIVEFLVGETGESTERKLWSDQQTSRKQSESVQFE